MTRFRLSTLSRRELTRGLIGGCMIAGFDIMNGQWVLADNALDATAIAALPRFDGDFLLDEASRNAYAKDYGNIVHKRPAAILRPGSVDDIVRVIEFARRCHLRIVARGQGHQPFGQSQVDRGIVIDMRSLNAIHRIEADSVEVAAGADWRSIVHATARQGLTPPVLPNYLGLTVGGTLSIGGIGIGAFRHGAQVDEVRSLQVVTGRGDVVDCDETTHSGLFNAALAGQGQCAVIVGSTLRLQSAPVSAREYLLPYPDLQSMLIDGMGLSQDGRFDGLVALIGSTPNGWSYAIAATRYFDPPVLPDDAALLSGLQFKRGAEQFADKSYVESVDVAPPVDFTKYHADLGLFVSQASVEPFLTGMLPRLVPDELGSVMGIRLFFLPRQRFTRPLMRLPPGGLFCYLALIRAQTDEPEAVKRMQSGNRELFETNRELAGTLYPFAALTMRPSDWRRHYGEQLEFLTDMKRRDDPQDVFPNLCGCF